MRSHDDCVTGGDDAFDSAAGCSNPVDFRLLQYPKAMSARHDLQAAAVLIGGIDMQSDGQHMIQYRARRLDMTDTILYRPRSPASHRCFFVQRDDLVLVPGDEPVLFGGLIEKQCSYQLRGAIEQAARHIQYGCICYEPGDGSEFLFQVSDATLPQQVTVQTDVGDDELNVFFRQDISADVNAVREEIQRDRRVTACQDNGWPECDTAVWTAAWKR